MLTGHAMSLHESDKSSDLVLEDPVSEIDEDAELSTKVLYRASFEELVQNYLHYDMIIWVGISLLLVLAWGIGALFLLYLPVRRYVLQKDIYSRRLYVTPHEIVYKVTRPLFLPFLGVKKIEKHIPLHLVIDIIIEQGCLQSVYGIHTFRVESIARGKATRISELQVQGLSNPELLRKIIVTEAARNIQEVGYWKSNMYARDEGSSRLGRLAEVPAADKLRTPKSKSIGTPGYSVEAVDAIPSDMLLDKLDEVKQSAKRIESLLKRERPEIA